MTDTRAAGRYNLDLPIVIATLPQKTPVMYGTTRNISTDGVYFTTDLRLAIGASLEFTLTLPQVGTLENSPTISGTGRVVRVEESTSDPKNIGIAMAIESFRTIRADPPAS
jgi:hypothetical protein